MDEDLRYVLLWAGIVVPVSWGMLVAALSLAVGWLFPLRLRPPKPAELGPADYKVGMAVDVRPTFHPEDDFEPFAGTIVALDEPGDRLPIVTVREPDGKKSDWLPGNIYPHIDGRQDNGT